MIPLIQMQVKTGDCHICSFSSKFVNGKCMLLIWHVNKIRNCICSSNNQFEFWRGNEKDLRKMSAHRASPLCYHLKCISSTKLYILKLYSIHGQFILIYQMVYNLVWHDFRIDFPRFVQFLSFLEIEESFAAFPHHAPLQFAHQPISFHCNIKCLKFECLS